MLRRHAYPVLGDRPLSSTLPSDIQAWVKGLELAPATIGVVHGVVSTIMKAAIRDQRIVANPCDGSKLPKVERSGTGMRQGEWLGLTVDRVKFLERTLTVDRQLVTVPGQPPSLGPPKTQASNRTIPLLQVVVDALAAHLAAFPSESDGLLFTLSGKPITRQAFGHKWRPAVAKAGLPAGTGFHALRHYYASLLIRHGESVKTVQARLGHASAVETLDTYSHLWPDSGDRTRDAGRD
jgi:integrase